MVRNMDVPIWRRRCRQPMKGCSSANCRLRFIDAVERSAISSNALTAGHFDPLRVQPAAALRQQASDPRPDVLWQPGAAERRPFIENSAVTTLRWIRIGSAGDQARHARAACVGSHALLESPRPTNPAPAPWRRFRPWIPAATANRQRAGAADVAPLPVPGAEDRSPPGAP